MDRDNQFEVSPPGRSEAERRIRSGVSWIGALAVIWAITTPIQFAMNQLTADETLAAANTPGDGEEVVGEDALPLRLGAPIRDATLAINLLFVGAWGGMWLRARHKARPALRHALVLLFLIAVGSAIWQPKALLSGLVITLLTLILLGRALKATREPAAAPPS